VIERVIRSWRIRDEGPGYVCFFDPRVEHVRLFAGRDPDMVPFLQYEVREGREAGEAVDPVQLEMDGLAECEISAICKGGDNASWPDEES